MAKRPTRLELHRLKYQAASGKLPLLFLKELSEKEKKMVSDDFFSRELLGDRLSDPHTTLAAVLASWGVMCTHPPQLGVAEKLTKATEARWFVCSACGCRVLADHHPLRAEKAAEGEG